MASSKTATLSGLLVSKKAGPPAHPEHPGLEEAQTPGHHSPVSTRREATTPGKDSYYKALTLKVDKARFTKLKNLGMQRDLRSQALMTEALDLLFAKHQL